MQRQQYYTEKFCNSKDYLPRKKNAHPYFNKQQQHSVATARVILRNLADITQPKLDNINPHQFVSSIIEGGLQHKTIVMVRARALILQISCKNHQSLLVWPLILQHQECVRVCRSLQESAGVCRSLLQFSGVRKGVSDMTNGSLKLLCTYSFKKSVETCISVLCMKYSFSI